MLVHVLITRLCGVQKRATGYGPFVKIGEDDSFVCGSVKVTVERIKRYRINSRKPKGEREEKESG